jgi:hypothetical protein
MKKYIMQRNTDRQMAWHDINSWNMKWVKQKNKDKERQRTAQRQMAKE